MDFNWSQNTKKAGLVLFGLLVLAVPFFIANVLLRKGSTDNRSRAAIGENNEGTPIAGKISARALNTTSSEVKTENVLDGNPHTIWSSGKIASKRAPVWIELDLGELKNVSSIRLNVNQNPAGETVHEIYGGASPNPNMFLGRLEGVTTSGQWLNLIIPQGGSKPIRYIRISTTKSPSWVAWSDIVIYERKLITDQSPSSIKTGNYKPIGDKENINSGKVLGIRTQPGEFNGEIYNRQTGAREYLRGHNYTYLIDADKSAGVNLANFLFDAGNVPKGHGSWREKYGKDLGDMQKLGYNSIRVFVNNSAPYSDETIADVKYWDKFIEMLKETSSRGINVIASTDNMYNKYLIGEKYRKEFYCVKHAVSDPEPDFCGWNWAMLDKNGVAAYQDYLKSFIGYLKSKNAPMERMLYTIYNETFFNKTSMPFCADKPNDTVTGCQKPYIGKVIAANGNTYNMPADADKLRSEGLIYFINTISRTIKELDEGALTAVQYVLPMIWQNNPEVGITTSNINGVIYNSNVDIISISYYPGMIVPAKSLDQVMLNIGFDKNKPTNKAFMVMEMGFLGTYGQASANKTPKQACEGIKKIIYDTSCNYNFSGWNLWTYDAEGEGWHTSKSNNSYLGNQLSPNNFPSSCVQLKMTQARNKKLFNCN